MMFGDEWERGRRRAIESARQSAPGLPKEQLVPGAIVTLSPCLCTGDRSFSHELYEILARNEGHVVIKRVNALGHDSFGRRPHTVSIHEHEFYGAEHMLAVMQDAEPKQTEPPADATASVS